MIDEGTGRGRKGKRCRMRVRRRMTRVGNMADKINNVEEEDVEEPQ